jgi:hypothetical protein
MLVSDVTGPVRGSHIARQDAAGRIHVRHVTMTKPLMPRSRRDRAGRLARDTGEAASLPAVASPTPSAISPTRARLVWCQTLAGEIVIDYETCTVTVQMEIAVRANSAIDQGRSLNTAGEDLARVVRQHFQAHAGTER